MFFYQITFPTDDKTFIYNATVGSWSTLTEPGGGRMIANAHTFFNNQHIIGGYNNGNLYQLSEDFGDADGEARKLLRTSDHFYDKSYNSIRINRVELDIVSGRSDTNGPYSEPKVWLNVSYDGGRTFTNLSPFNTAKRGVYSRRIIYRKLGVAKDFVFQIQSYSKVPFVILGMVIDYDVLSR